MLNFKPYLRVCFALMSAQVAHSQYFIGYHSSNYAGLNGISINPTSIVDSRHSLEFNLAGADFNFSNNYLGLSTKLFSIKNSPFADTTYNNNFQGFRRDFMKEKSGISSARIFQNLQIQGPSLSFQVGKNAFALTTAFREYFYVDNLEPVTADFILSELKKQSVWDVNLNNQKFNTVAAIWSEFGIAYGREVLNTGEHFLKAAIHPKLVFAAGSTYFYADQLQLQFRNNDTLNVNVSNINFGYSNNLRDNDIFQKPYGANLLKKTSFALDFGVTYEWRPKWRDYQNPRDTSKLVKHKNKYKAKVGLSVTDLGTLRFDRGTFGGNFAGTAQSWDLNTIDIQGIESFGRLMSDTFSMTTNREPYRLRLPTAISIQADYNIWKGFYVNATAYMGFHHNDALKKLHALNNFSITPRFEHYWGDVSLPMSIDGYGNFNAGASLRLSAFFVGSTNALNYWLGDQVRGLNVYAGVKIAIPYTRPREPKPLPVDSPITKIDTPIVKIDTPIVKIDTPIVKIDTPIVKVDTPIVKIDTPIVKIDTPIVKIDTPIVKIDTPIVKIDTPAVKIDSPQIVIKPIEPRPIKADTTDESDPLPVPTDSKRYKYQGHEYVIQPFELTLADNSVYFATGSAEISKKEALKLDTLVMNMQKIKNSRILAHGYADTIGSNKLNEQLSQRRAVSIQNYLVKKGIAKDRIVVDAFGAARPVEDNRTEQGRRLNRRVEIFLLLQESIKVNKANKPK